MKTLKLLALSLMACWAMAAQAELQQIQVSASETKPLGADYLYYNFGFVGMNTISYVRYDVTNTGTVPLNFNYATISGPGYDAYHSCTGTLYPQQRCWFEVRFHAYFSGPNSGRFVLSFQENVAIILDLWADVQRW